MTALGCCGVVAPIPDVGGATHDEGLATFNVIQDRILTPSCALSNCHGAPLIAPMALTTDVAYANLVDSESEQLPTMMRVAPSDTEASYLLHKVLGTAGDVGGKSTRMPLNRTLLTQSEIDLISLWISNGALDD
jgi:hypothetical protein